jgi:hypothetical protein
MGRGTCGQHPAAADMATRPSIPSWRAGSDGGREEREKGERERCGDVAVDMRDLAVGVSHNGKGEAGLLGWKADGPTVLADSPGTSSRLS